MKAKKIHAAYNEETVFMKMVRKYLPYWPLFLLFLVVVSVSSFIYLRYASPKFEATASLIIKDEKKGNEDSKFMESLNMVNAKKIIENEIDIIQSRPILNDVVNKLHLYAPILYSNGVNLVSAYQFTPVFIESKDPGPLQETKKEIRIRLDSVSERVYIDGKSYALREWVSTPYGQLRFLKNEKKRRSALQVPLYFRIDGVDKAVKRVQDNLKVSATNKLSSVVKLSYREDNAQLSEDVLNALINSYFTISYEEKRSVARNALNFIEQRLGIAAAGLDSIEKKVQHYKSARGAVDISTQGQLFLQNVSANDQKISETNMQLMVINNLEKFVAENEDRVGIVPSSLGVNDPVLVQLINNLNTAELDKEKLRKTVGENNPVIVSVNDQISKLKGNILDHIQTQRKSLETGKQTLSSTNNNYNAMLQSIPSKERELLEINRDRNIKNDIYSFLLQKREESQLSYASTLTDSKVVNYAKSSDSPVSPNKFLVLGIGLIAILLLPIILINAREAFSAGILYRQDIEAITSIPIVGEIAFNRKRDPLVVQPKVRSFLSEEFRNIRNTLAFKGINGKHKKILVTSGISGEGKSFVAANLAVSYSLAGNKTILVDLDLHNSSLGKVFSISRESGITDFLSGEVELEEIITKIPGYDNLYFISAGSIKEDMSAFLESRGVKDLISLLGAQFDIAVFDTEPVELVTDARLLSLDCDATLYIVRHLYSPKILLKRFSQNNKLSPLFNPAIIFNGVKTRGFMKNNYGYGYGYVYGEKELKERAKKATVRKITIPKLATT